MYLSLLQTAGHCCVTVISENMFICRKKGQKRVLIIRKKSRGLSDYRTLRQLPLAAPPSCKHRVRAQPASNLIMINARVDCYFHARPWLAYTPRQTFKVTLNIWSDVWTIALKSTYRYPYIQLFWQHSPTIIWTSCIVSVGYRWPTNEVSQTSLVMLPTCSFSTRIVSLLLQIILNTI